MLAINISTGRDQIQAGDALLVQRTRWQIKESAALLLLRTESSGTEDTIILR